MNRRVAGLWVLGLSVVALGASVADWAVVDTSTTVEAATGPLTVPGQQTLNGTELAGPLVAVALAGMVLAGLIIGFRAAGYAAPVLAAAGLALVGSGWPGEGAVTAAPGIAAAACAAIGVVGVLATRAPTATPGREAPPSRYTVEAVRGEQAAPADEWDLAVANDARTDDEPVEDDHQ